MIFNHPGFMFLFLPVAGLLFFCPGLERVRLAGLICMSLLFYKLSAGTLHVLILLGCSLWVYVGTSGRWIQGNRLWLALSVALPLAVLIKYKYAEFLLSLIPGVIGSASGAKGEMPAGISFYVFHLVSYAIDRFRGTWGQVPSLPRFICYVAFFPQLVAGPITRFREVADSIAGLSRFRLSAARAEIALTAFALGLAVKVLLADPLSHALAPLIARPDGLGARDIAFLVFGYSFRIYFDFYGYSMMAIGLGSLFGIQLPRNFNHPYRSADPKEFWRRWHMTLSFWIRDYLYLPLGGNRAHARNILIVFTACGLWHGAGLNFVAWGLYHGLLALLYAVTQPVWNRMALPLRVALTFTLVSVGWLLFVFDLGTFAAVMTSIPASFDVPGIGVPLPSWGLLAVATGVAFLIDTDRMLVRHEDGGHPLVAVRAVALGLAMTAGIALADGSEPFIYFQF